MKLTIERVRAFNGLDVLVARDEGLFAAEGLDLRIAAPAPAECARPPTARSPSRSRTRGCSSTAAKPRMFQG